MYTYIPQPGNDLAFYLLGTPLSPASVTVAGMLWAPQKY